MKSCASVVIVALIAGQAAPVAEAPSAGFQAVRLGDSRLSCQALVDEINALNRELTETQTAMTERAIGLTRATTGGVQGASAASTAVTLGLGVASALIPGAGLALGAVQGLADAANQAAAVAHEAEQERRMDEMMTEMSAGGEAMMPVMSRIDHLTDISITKGC